MDARLAPVTYFRIAAPIARRPERLRIDGRLSEWGAGTLLPDTMELEGKPGFARVHAAWDEDGLYFGVSVAEKANVVSQRQNPRAGDALLLWIDTRDVHDVHRASRHCHCFIALPRGGGEDRQSAAAWQGHVHRAKEQAPVCRPATLRVSSCVTDDGYGLELAIPASALNGYEPEAWRRIGFNYLVCDHEHGCQTWTAQPRLPFDWDPSMWGTLELGC